MRMLATATAALMPLQRAAAAGTDLVVAQVAPFSGPQAVTGKAIHAGARLYFDAVNARGGVRGQTIRLVTRDDQQKSVDTVRLIKEVIAQEHPVALLGTVGTSNLEAVGKDGVLQRASMAMVGAVSGAASVAATPGMYVVKASYRDEIDRLFRQLAELGLRRVGLVYQNDGLGQDVLAGAEAAARRYSINLVASAHYERNTTEVQACVSDMVKAAPQVIFLGATTAAGVEFVRQYDDAGGKATMYGMSIIDTDALIKKLGPAKARGYAFSVVLPLSIRTNREVVREYLKLIEAHPDPDLSARSIEGFIAAKALVKVLESTPNPTSSAVATALSGATDLDVGGYHLNFSLPERTGSRYVDFAMIGEGGRIFQ